jgi:hypothetical protein
MAALRAHKYTHSLWRHPTYGPLPCVALLRPIVTIVPSGRAFVHTMMGVIGPDDVRKYLEEDRIVTKR